ncbi:MAG: MerR family transcriptional regulator [Tannerella sp.]|jgi:DNA-binding transcriptional MerR regulator|nr:MerR family transcriptional regulator [Tannerella sp.]
MGKQEKESKLFFSIKEVSQMIGLNESTLRFWEKEFEEIAPRKTGKGTRYYQEEDIEQIRLVYHLVKEQKMTLAGARQRLKVNKNIIINQVEIANRLKQIRSELMSLADALENYGNGKL